MSAPAVATTRVHLGNGCLLVIPCASLAVSVGGSEAFHSRCFCVSSGGCDERAGGPGLGESPCPCDCLRAPAPRAVRRANATTAAQLAASTASSPPWSSSLLTRRTPGSQSSQSREGPRDSHEDHHSPHGWRRAHRRSRCDHPGNSHFRFTEPPVSVLRWEDRGFVLREDRGSRSYTVRKGNTFAQDLEVFFGATEGSCPAALADTDAGTERARYIRPPRVYEVLFAFVDLAEIVSAVRRVIGENPGGQRGPSRGCAPRTPRLPTCTRHAALWAVPHTSRHALDPRPRRTGCRATRGRSGRQPAGPSDLATFES